MWPSLIKGRPAHQRAGQDQTALCSSGSGSTSNRDLLIRERVRRDSSQERVECSASRPRTRQTVVSPNGKTVATSERQTVATSKRQTVESSRSRKRARSSSTPVGQPSRQNQGRNTIVLCGRQLPLLQRIGKDVCGSQLTYLLAPHQR